MLLPEKAHGQSSLENSGPRGYKELDMTERLGTWALDVSKDTDLELGFQGKRALYFCFMYLEININFYVSRWTMYMKS